MKHSHRKLFQSCRVGPRNAVSPFLERLEERALLSTGLVGAYSFDEGSGTILHDTSGSGNNGTITNATWSTAGKFGDALSFTGSLNSWVTIANSSSLDLTTGMTLEAWVDPTSLNSPDAGWAAAIAKEHQNSGNDISYGLYAANGTGTPPAGHILVGNTDYGAQGTSVLPLKTWTFLSATYDGTTLKTYINGTQVGSTTIKGSIFTTTDPLRIGGDWDSEMFTGLIDNVRIYNTALTQAQILTDMTTPVTSAPPTAPAVTSETPISGATGVATNSSVTATFNEAVQASSITTSTFVLKGPGGSAVTAAVSYNSTTNTATLAPATLLANSTTYTATISGVTDAAGHVMASPFSWSYTTGPAPTVTSFTPASNATGIGVASTVTATFNEAVQSSTIGFTLKSSSGTTVAATLAYNSSTNTATWTPSAALAYSTTYTATVSGAKDTAGDPMSKSATWSFTTSAQPAVTSHTPASGATGVGVASTVTATFNEAVQSSTIGFTLKNSSGNTVATTLSYNSSTHIATWTPSAALASSTTYTATVSGVKDMAGDPMSGPVTWSFTTAALAIVPTVTSETPISGATRVATNTSVTATFNEAVQASSITTSTFVLKGPGGSAVTAAVSYNSTTNTATLSPATLLANSTTYTATISGVTDAAGHVMASPFSWSYTTGPAPTVTSFTPASSATGIGVASTVTATFNEAVQSSTIGFTLRSSSGTTVAATLAYNSSTNTATWTPSAALAYSTTYTATVSGAKDTAGDPMTAPVSWSFTTAALALPTVTTHTPASGATSVAVSSTVTATFNEAVQSSTIIFTLTSSSGSSVAAAVTYNNTNDTATLTPSVALAYSTTYTATVSGAQNVAGGAMAAPVSWSFTTAAQSTSTGDPTTLAPSLGPPPSPGPNVIWVSTQAALQTAVSTLQSGQTIVIQPGTYTLTSTLYVALNGNITNVTIRGATDNFNDVTLVGKGMDNASYGNVPMGISIWHAQNVTIADLSIGDIYYDPIEVKGDVGASAVTIYHVHLFDAGEQFLKSDPPSSGVGASNSAVEYSMIDYTNGPPTTDHGGGIGYTNGIDIHDGSNWLIAHNLIENLHTPDSDPAANLWNPAILLWNHSSNMTVVGNTIINCDRAIASGLIDQSTGYDNQGGIIENNFVYQAPGLFSPTRAAASDGQIIVWDSPNTQVLFNTILTDGNSTNSIQLRWTTTGDLVEDNLSDASIRARDGATYTASGNYLSATPSMFVNPSAGDLHLVLNSATETNLIDQVIALAADPSDWNGNARVAGSLTDIGADASLSLPSGKAIVLAGGTTLSVAGSAGMTSQAETWPDSADVTSTIARANSSTATKWATFGGSNKAPIGVVAGPIALTVTRRKVTQSGVKSPWSQQVL
jgi:methionine-rich copper-binding protein CopC